MDWEPSQFDVINEHPRVEFDYPVHWKATKLLEDHERKSYLVAVATDPVSGKTLHLSGSSGNMVLMRRVFRQTEKGWEHAEDAAFEFAVLRATD